MHIFCRRSASYLPSPVTSSHQRQLWNYARRTLWLCASPTRTEAKSCRIRTFCSPRVPSGSLPSPHTSPPFAGGELVVSCQFPLVPINKLKLSSHHSRESRDKIFSSEHELYNILDSTDGPDVSSISHTAVTDYDKLPRCFATDDRRQPCICSLQICIDWWVGFLGTRISYRLWQLLLHFIRP